jgi:ribonucleoside-triphosphate reductase
MAAPKSIRVVKTSGDIEVFDPNVITQECIEAGIELYTAAEVALEVSKRIYDGISTREIQESTLEVLYKKHPEAAERYKRFHSMLVRTSRNTIEPFDRKKIARSLIKETRLPRELADMIARESEEELRRLKLDFISAPLIREVVNVKLLEHGFERPRADYTRLGIPVYDATELIEAGIEKDPSLADPELLHTHMAGNIFKEYVLLKVLPLHLADAHMRGEIHIHNLDYFVSRPYSVNHDLRWFLEEGLELGVKGRKLATGPAKTPRLAFLLASKVLSGAQTNIAEKQRLECFNVFLAPYVQGLSYPEVKELAGLFILDSQINSRSIELGIEYGCPDFLQEYRGYEEEIKTLAEALTEVYAGGDARGRGITLPLPCYSSRKGDYQRAGYDEFISRAHELAINFKTPLFANRADPLSTRGTLQIITLNLPRAAYAAKGEDDRLFETLRERLMMAREALMIKRELMEHRSKKGLLPFLGQRRDGEEYYSLDKVEHAVGYVGLNEMVKAHTGEEIHKSRAAMNFGLRVLRSIAKTAKEWGKETGLRWGLTTAPKASTAYRLAKLDYGEFSEKAVVSFDEEGKPYYTSLNVRRAPALSLKEFLTMESAFQALTAGEVPVTIAGEFNSAAELAELSKNITANTAIKTWRFQ